MKMKKAIILVFSLILVLSLASCGKKAENGGSEETKSNIPNGFYKLIELEEDGEPVAPEDLELMESLGLKIYLKVNEDHSGYLNIFGEKSELSFDENNITLEGESVPYTFDGTTISIEKDGSKMVFTETEPIDEEEDIDISALVEDAEVLDESEIIADADEEEAVTDDAAATEDAEATEDTDATDDAEATDEESEENEG